MFQDLPAILFSTGKFLSSTQNWLNIKLNGHQTRLYQPERRSFLLNHQNLSNMKKIYFTFIPLTFFLLAGCSKDFLKRYEKRLPGGTWELYDVNNFGIGSGYSPGFTSGRFVFESNGDLTYTSNNGDVYFGSWDIRRNYQGDEQQQSLFITVVDSQTQHVISEYFNDMQFTGTNRFKAFIYSGSRTYTCKFKR